MAAPDQPRLTPRQTRRIGLELGGFLVVVAGVLAYRGTRPEAAAAAGAIGLLLSALAVARPVLLLPLAQRWMGFASGISRVTSPLLLGVIYLVVFTPMAWMRRTFGRTPVARDAAAATYWLRREPLTTDTARRGMERPF